MSSWRDLAASDVIAVTPDCSERGESVVVTATSAGAPAISVIVPAHDVAAYIAEALQSVAAQTFTDFEAIIVDDGSTDVTRELIETFCAGDPRFTAILQEAQGVSAARNAGLDVARGEYVAFLDGDDMYLPTTLELLHGRATATGADLVIGDYEIFDDVHSWHVPEMRTLLELPAYGPLDPALLSCYVIWNKLYRRTLIEQANLRFPPYVYAQDSVFAMRYAYLCETIATLPEDVCRYRRRSLFGELSATQVISLRSEHDHLATHADIRAAAIRRWDAALESAAPSDRPQVERPRAEYIDRLSVKEADRLVGARYANFWHAEEGVAELISARVAELHRAVPFAAWQRLARRYPDLPLAELPSSKEHAAERPMISVIVWDDGADPAALESTLHSIYAQRFPLFDVYVTRATAQLLPQHLRHFANMRVVDAEDRASLVARALESTCAEYVLIAEAHVVYRITAFRRIWKRLSASNCDALTCPVAHVGEDEQPRVISAHAIAFQQPTPARGTLDPSRTALDLMLSNKLIRTSYLRLSGFTPAAAQREDAEALYRDAYVLQAPGERLMYTSFSEERFTLEILGLAAVPAMPSIPASAVLAAATAAPAAPPAQTPYGSLIDRVATWLAKRGGGQ